MPANAEDALDATQDALVAIVFGINRFDGRAKFTTWCYRVAMNAALDETRRRVRRPTPVDTVVDLAGKDLLSTPWSPINSSLIVRYRTFLSGIASQSRRVTWSVWTTRRSLWY